MSDPFCTGDVRGDHSVYTGIGSRETPPEVLDFMATFGYVAAKQGIMLRSGGAPGADQAFEYGSRLAGQHPEVYLPWASFEGGRDNPACTQASDKAMEIAAQHHPRWQYLRRGAKLLHARNVHQVLGPDCDSPTGMVICWTKDGGPTGGTGQAIRIAEAYDVPVANLHSSTVRTVLGWYMEGYEKISFAGLDSLPNGV